MRICVPTETNRGLEAVVSDHIGRARFLTLFDTSTGEVTVLPNLPHGEATCAPAKPLAGRGVEAVVCRGAGKRAVGALNKAGIRVLVTGATRASEAVSDFSHGLTTVLDAKDACDGRHVLGEPAGHRHRGGCGGS